jgi:predicted transposase YdaD
MEIISSYRREGRQEGREEGRQEGKEELACLILEDRFSTLPEGLTQRLDKLTSEQLNELCIASLRFSSLDDLDQWLNNH